jgi:F-type H+-transporting ATPase subunit alpha
MIFAGVHGHVDDLPVGAIRAFEQGLTRFVQTRYPEITQDLRQKKEITEELRRKMEQGIREFKEEFKAQKPSG